MALGMLQLSHRGQTELVDGRLHGISRPSGRNLPFASHLGGRDALGSRTGGFRQAFKADNQASGAPGSCRPSRETRPRRERAGTPGRSPISPPTPLPSRAATLNRFDIGPQFPRSRPPSERGRLVFGIFSDI